MSDPRCDVVGTTVHRCWCGRCLATSAAAEQLALEGAAADRALIGAGHVIHRDPGDEDRYR